jgi:hypothetical protein
MAGNADRFLVFLGVRLARIIAPGLPWRVTDGKFEGTRIAPLLPKPILEFCVLLGLQALRINLRPTKTRRLQCSSDRPPL